MIKTIQRLIPIVATVVVFSQSYCVYGQTQDWSENDYANYIQSLIGGDREVLVENGRVDLVTDSIAYEIEWANHWKESIGQSLWYAIQTNRTPGIILIMRSREDYKYFIQLNSTLKYAGLDQAVHVNVFPLDFEELIKNREKN